MEIPPEIARASLEAEVIRIQMAYARIDALPDEATNKQARLGRLEDEKAAVDAKLEKLPPPVEEVELTPKEQIRSAVQQARDQVQAVNELIADDEVTKEEVEVLYGIKPKPVSPRP